MPTKKYIFHFVVFLTSVFVIPACSNADEARCVASFGKGVIATENSVPFVKSGNNCKAADQIETALNWLGTAEAECAYDRNKLNEVMKLKNQLVPQLARFVSKCGH